MSSPSPASGGAASGADVQRSFKTVFIPADKSKQVEEWTITYNNATEVSCMLDRLKRHFAGGSSAVDQASLRASVREQIAATLAKQHPEAAGKPIDDAMVDMILQMSSVDCVPLQNNKASTNYIGLMMYVDDQGKAKNLPLNERATMVTSECGIPTAVLGDTVIARNFDDENLFKRLDFTLEEYFKSKEWRLSARKANAERAEQGSKSAQLQELLAQAQKGRPSGSAAAATAAAPEHSVGDISGMLDQASARLAAQAAAPPVPKTCSNPACERDAAMRCSRCKRSSYCSVECQKKDFKFHRKNVCIPKDAAVPTKDNAPAAAAETKAPAEEATEMPAAAETPAAGATA